MKPGQSSELLEVQLTASEIEEKHKSLKDQTLERIRQKAEAKRIAEGFASKLKLLDQSIEELAHLLDSGKEWRSVDCEERIDWDAACVRIVRLDTLETIRTREIKPEERNRKLFEDETGGLSQVSSEEAVAQFFDKPAPPVVAAGLEFIGEFASGQSESDEQPDLGGTPMETERDFADLMRIQQYYCADKIAAERPVTLCYIDEAPMIVTSKGPGYTAEAWHVLPQSIAGVKLTYNRPDAERGYLHVEFHVGPKKDHNWWVVVGPKETFSLKPGEADDFTAPRCEECGQIDGGHAETCSQHAFSLWKRNRAKNAAGQIAAIDQPEIARKKKAVKSAKQRGNSRARTTS